MHFYVNNLNTTNVLLISIISSLDALWVYISSDTFHVFPMIFHFPDIFQHVGQQS